MNKSAKSLPVETAARSPAPTPAERQSMIEVAAYYLYERSGCNPDRALDYWLQAEAQIDEQFKHEVDEALAAPPAKTAAKPATAKPAPAKPVSAKPVTAAKPAGVKKAAAKAPGKRAAKAAA